MAVRQPCMAPLAPFCAEPLAAWRDFDWLLMGLGPTRKHGFLRQWSRSNVGFHEFQCPLDGFEIHGLNHRVVPRLGGVRKGRGEDPPLPIISGPGDGKIAAGIGDRRRQRGKHRQIEPQDWCNKFNASLVKPLKTLKLTSRLTPIAAWISTAACATFGAISPIPHSPKKEALR